ncbi:hypothetical protein AO256_13895 [Pseudomonas syringae]|nr:hypothetical protein AO256_13895 [Pseudomonas syringae]
MRNDNLNSVLRLCVRQLNYRATLCVVMPFRTLRVLFATQSVVMPFRTLRVLFATQSVENCIPTGA